MPDALNKSVAFRRYTVARFILNAWEMYGVWIQWFEKM
jgi:hypothetical protein